jgi:hypothetical protein
MLSKCIIILSFLFKYNTLNNFFNQIAYETYEVITTSSASMIDKVIIGCFLNDHEIAHAPIINT